MLPGKLPLLQVVKQIDPSGRYIQVVRISIYYPRFDKEIVPLNDIPKKLHQKYKPISWPNYKHQCC